MPIGSPPTATAGVPSGIPSGLGSAVHPQPHRTPWTRDTLPPAGQSAVGAIAVRRLFECRTDMPMGLAVKHLNRATPRRHRRRCQSSSRLLFLGGWGVHPLCDIPSGAPPPTPPVVLSF